MLMMCSRGSAGTGAAGYHRSGRAASASRAAGALPGRRRDSRVRKGEKVDVHRPAGEGALVLGPRATVWSILDPDIRA